MIATWGFFDVLLELRVASWIDMAFSSFSGD